MSRPRAADDSQPLRMIYDSISFERNLLVLGATNTAMSVFWNSWYPFIAIYLSKMGAGPAESGVLFSFLFLASSLGYLTGGYMADRFGRMFPIISGGGLASLCLFATRFIQDWRGTGILLVLGTCFLSLQSPSPPLMVAESTVENDRGKALGNWGFYSNIGPLVGPMLGGILSPTFQLGPLLFSSSIAIGIATVIRGIGLRETFDRDSIGPKVRLEFRFPTSRNLLLFLVSCSAVSLCSGLTWAFIPLFASSFICMSSTELGTMFSINSLAMLVASIPCGKIVDRFGTKNFLVVGYSLTCLLYIPWMYSPIPVIAILLSAIQGICLQLGSVAYQKAVIGMTLQKVRGTVTGGFDAVYHVANSAGSALGGWIWEGSSPHMLFWVAGLLGVPTALIMSLVHINHTEAVKAQLL